MTTDPTTTLGAAGAIANESEHLAAIRRLAYPDYPYVVGPITARQIVKHADALDAARRDAEARAEKRRRDIRREVYSEVLADLLASGLRMQGAFATIARHWVDDLRDELQRLNGGVTSVHDVDLIAEAVEERNGAMREVGQMASALKDEQERSARLRESEAKMAALVRLASGPHAKRTDVEAGIALARRGLHPGDLDEGGAA